MVIDANGEIVFEGRSGPANVATTPRPYLAMSIKRALDGCPKADYVCGCFAGLIAPEYSTMIESMLKEFLPEAKISVFPDFRAALAATRDTEAICVLSGTGSLICSLDKDGIVRKTGGGGVLIGDEGSTYCIGRKVLQYYVRNKPEDISDTLHEAIPRIFGVKDPQAVVARVYRDLTPAARIAMLVPTVARDWDAGEPYAKQIICTEMNLLAQLTKKHLMDYSPDKTNRPIYLAGGLWNVSSVFKEVFERELKTVFPESGGKTQKISQPPVSGAALLAKEMYEKEILKP